MKNITGLVLSLAFLFLLIPSVFAQQQDTKQLQKGQLIKVPDRNREQTPTTAKRKNQVQSQESILFEEGFEAQTTGWGTSGTWAIGQPSSGPGQGYNSVNTAATNLTGNYPDNAEAYLVSPSITLPSNNRQIVLRFNEWFEIESGYDYGYIEISTDDGTSWRTLRSRNGASDWRTSEIDLSTYKGESIRLRFRMETDESDAFAGWYVDNVQVTSQSQQPLTLEVSSLNSQNFPNIYANVKVDTSGAGFPDLTQENFTVYENGSLQTDLFQVTPPEEGGGVRRADIIFLMDNSGSMSEEQEAVQENVFDFVDALSNSNVDFALGLARYGASQNYGDPIIEDGGSLTSDATYFKDNVWMRNVISGGTEPGYYAMTQSASDFNFRPGAQRIFIIITDERPDQGGASQSDALAALEGGDVTLFALTESNLYDDFQPLTDVTGGQLFDIYSSFDDILNFIATEVASTYVVSYKSSNPNFDGTTRNVRIEATHQGKTASDEASYVPGAAPTIQRTQPTIALSDDGQPENRALPIEATITDDIAPDIQRATLFYKRTPDPASSYQSVEMTNTSGNTYRAGIPGNNVLTPGMDYYITATDGNTTSSSPSTNPGAHPFNIAVLPNKPPVIEHTPVTQATENQPVDIAFNATDNTRELERVKLYYRKTGRLNYEVETVENFVNQSDFQLTIPAEFVTTDGVEYYIESEDDWGVTSTLPKEDAVDVPFAIAVNPAWPDVEGPAIIVKVMSEGSKKINVDKVSLVNALNIVSTKSLAKDNLVVFGKDNLTDKISRILLQTSNDRLIGHMWFKYTVDDVSAGKRIDAILYVNTEDSLQPDLKNYPGWNYYKKGEHPVSMLIPPNGNYTSIDESRKPLLMVHGVSGYYPYWGENMIKKLNQNYDTWRFYYPYDQEIEKSASLLGEALHELSSSNGLANYKALGGRIDVVAHSMGGLVTRSYIQSKNYKSNINKFLMLGTPNHGSFIAYRFFYEKIAGTLGWLAGKDNNAPGYKQMTPGSNFLFHLDKTKPKQLFSEKDIKKSYIVIAGTEDFSILLPHEEISNQDDGLVAVSSANLLEYAIPLATVDFSHTSTPSQIINSRHLTEDTGEIILMFLHKDYNPSNSPPNLGKDITGFWFDEDNGSTSDENIDTDKGILTLKIPGSTVSKFKIGQDESELELNYPSIGLGTRLLQQIGKTSNYFAKRNIIPDDIGLDVPEEDYQVKIQRCFIGICSLYKTIDSLPFKHLQTTMGKIDLDASELTITNAKNTLEASKLTQNNKTSISNSEYDSQFYVDATVDSLTFWLAGFEEGRTHDMQLISPSGTLIDSTAALNASDMEFKQNLTGGFAFYYLENPKPGTWTVQYNEGLEDAVLSAPVISDIDTEINFTSPDSAYVVGNEIALNITVGSGSCTNRQASATLYIESEKKPVKNLGAVSLNTQSNGTKYQGQFTTEQPGIYFVESNFECSKNNKRVRRQSFTSIAVSGTEIPDQLPEEVLLNQNYPNPFSGFTTITYTLPEDQHVTLTVYDVLGRKVVTLVDEEQKAAKHFESFNARSLGLASGVYLYRLVTDENTKTEKMMFIR